MPVGTKPHALDAKQTGPSELVDLAFQDQSHQARSIRQTSGLAAEQICVLNSTHKGQIRASLCSSTSGPSHRF